MLQIINFIIIIIIGFLCGELWRDGGNGYSLRRNPGVPIVIAIMSFAYCLNWLVFLYIPLAWAAIRGFSYGIKAPLHKLFVWIFGQGEDGNYLQVEIATRATCGFLWSLPSAVFAYVTGQWYTFIIYVIVYTINNLRINFFKDM